MGRNNYFQFKQFTVVQEKSAMKVGVDGVLLGAWTMHGNPLKILDVGTGTGVIALMMAQRFSSAIIHAVEIDTQACTEACLNFNQSPWSDRLQVLNNSFQQLAGSTVEKYDLVISNPPFFENSVHFKTASRELARNSKNLSLEEFFYNTKQILADNGILSVIYPASRFDELHDTAEKYGLYLNRLTFVKPNPEKIAHRVLAQFSFSRESFLPYELIIESTSHHDYTEAYRSLTRDFYLYF